MNNQAAWHSRRQRGIGSSDAPIIMGASPWKTKHSLFLEKTGRVKRDTTTNWAQQRGNNLEPKARARYEMLHGIECPPAELEHPEFPHWRANLDGWNEEHGLVLEIKAPGMADHTMAKEGTVPEKYVWQLEHQLIVSSGKVAHYFSYYEGKDGKVDTALVVYKSDPKRKAALLKELHAFWDAVKSNTPPVLTEKDALVLDDDLGAKDIFTQLAECMVERDEALAVYEKLESKYIELKGRAARFLDRHSRVRACGVEIVHRKRGSKMSVEARFVS